jgi:hypothetical protein
MIWLTWRQFRTPALVAASALVATLALLALTGPTLAHDFGTRGLADCAAGREVDVGTLTCGDLERQFTSQYPPLRLLGSLLAWLPALIGAFWGAPLVARELEGGTQRLAWVQSVTRTRWLGVKLAGIGLAGAGLTLLLGLAFTWWSGPFDRLTGRMNPGLFAQRGLVPLGYAAFAFALGVAAGAVIRRTLPAMAAVLGGFALARLVVENWARPRLLRPRELSYPTYTFFGDEPAARMSAHTGWVLSDKTLDGAGHVLGSGGEVRDDVVARLCGIDVDGITKEQLDACGRQLDLHTVVQVIPADRFWLLQTVETAIFLALALALLAFSFWWVRRRIG